MSMPEIREEIEPFGMWGGRNRHRRWARIAGSIIAGLLLAAAPASFAGEWTYSPYFQSATGYESALLLDPGGAALIVPGGVFLDFAPAFSMQKDTGTRGFLQFGTRAQLERFFNEVDRTLYAQVLWGDYMHRLGTPTRLRVSISGNYFNDTEQVGLRRFQAGVETGVSYFHRSFSLEAFAGTHAVSYPRAQAVDAQGNALDYYETRWNTGLEGSLSATSQLRFTGRVMFRSTSSVLSTFDSRSVLGDLALRWMPSRAWRFDAFYGMQTRSFDSRAAGFDEDDYQQWGIGLVYRLKQDLQLRARWAAGRYTDTLGQDEPTDRIEFSIDLGPAVFGVQTEQSLIATPSDFSGRNDGMDPRGVRFRLHAPEAVSVAVVGDFNGWDSQAHPLRSSGDGWWELYLPLSPGSYQYVYLVDGTPQLPPGAGTTIDDGFGGRNGLLEVLPPSL